MTHVENRGDLFYNKEVNIYIMVNYHFNIEHVNSANINRMETVSEELIYTFQIQQEYFSYF